MNNYFYRLSFQDNLSSQLLTEAQTNTRWMTSHGFDILNLSPLIFRDSPLFNLIATKKGKPSILKMNPMTWYDWHTDETRRCAINMLVEGFDSQCFFGNRKDRDIVNITELKYEPHTYYLFNTQIKHAVLNLNNVRYMLSIGFNDPNTYESILEQLI